ncbi:hypothetical protein CEK26_003441 [Fusarium fujikuroi]|nr:hypothetical protein CEK27_003433 [Fusarium fujikuroi]QGI88441.1 hypothetical protein CEK25_003397 [Fusarium fujikuroi]QGJ01997.1 hypothetical protein CEK26_003441 [Fusarium fujikuroi]
MATPDLSLAEKLRSYSTCDVSDALLKVGVPHGGFLPNLSMRSPLRQEGDRKLIGPAYTVKFVRNTQTNAPKLKEHYIDTIPKDHVVFISAPHGIFNAVYGGLMSTRAKYSGAVGTVVDGTFRDLQDHRKLGYPVFARNVGTPSFYEIARPSEINVPVMLQDPALDVTINPGDIIFGDLNGVVCVPQNALSKIVEILPAQVEADDNMARDIAQGKTFTAAKKENTEICITVTLFNMTALRWGMLGTSFISDVVARSILASQNSTIAAVFGRNEARLTAFADKHGIAERYTSIDELLDKADIDVVYVGLPNHMHTPAVLAAAKRGKAILSEKSLATTMEDAKAIEKAVKDAGVFFLEGLMYLTHPLMKKTQELLLEGKIGTVKGVSGYYSANIWKKANPLSMGTIYNLGCYPVSLLHFVIETAFGSDAFAKRQLHGFGNISTEGSVHVRDASLTVRFDNGVLASLQSTDSYGNDSSFAILGDKGRIRFITNPWLPIAGDNIIEIKTYGGSTEQIIVPADMDAFGYQVNKVEDVIMSQSLAAFRSGRSDELRKLAEEHFQHDLNENDRDILKTAGSKVSTHATVGSLLGLGFGVLCAFRLRKMRLAYFNAFRAVEKPVEVKFADGRTQPIPDLTAQLAPSKWGDAATYFFFSIGGLFLGGETGLLSGTASASRTITKNPEAKERIEKAWKNYRIDVMKQEIKQLEGKSKLEQLFS